MGRAPLRLLEELARLLSSLLLNGLQATIRAPTSAIFALTHNPFIVKYKSCPVFFRLDTSTSSVQLSCLLVSWSLIPVCLILGLLFVPPTCIFGPKWAEPKQEVTWILFYK